MVTQNNDRISLRDEGCKIVQGPHPGFPPGKMALTAQHPCGLNVICGCNAKLNGCQPG
jgi:hypothetical protein